MAALLGIIVAGYRPAVVSDFDRTLTPLSEELARAIRSILANGGRFAVLSGNVKKAVDTHFFGEPEFRGVFAGRRELLKEFHLFPKIASEHWAYDVTQSDYRLVDSSKLAVELGKRDGNGTILPRERWDPDRGGDLLRSYESILWDLVRVFGLEKGLPGFPVAGNLVVDLGSQMDVRVTGEDSSDKARDAYVEYEERDCRERGVYLRELYAAYVNLRTGQFDPRRENGGDILRELRRSLEDRRISMPRPPLPGDRIPMVVRRAGRTNLEGVVVGMDKAWGLTKIAGVFGRPVWTLVYSGDEFEQGGNDFAALDMASALINVGGEISVPLVHPFAITANKKGPAGLVEYYGLIGDVLGTMGGRRSCAGREQ